MWLMAQMKACDMPMKKFIILGLPGQVDDRFGVVHHDEAGSGILHFFSAHWPASCPLLNFLHRHMGSPGTVATAGLPAGA